MAASVFCSMMEERRAASSAWPLAMAASLWMGRLSLVKRRGSQASMSEKMLAWPRERTDSKASLFSKREPAVGMMSWTQSGFVESMAS